MTRLFRVLVALCLTACGSGEPGDDAALLGLVPPSAPATSHSVSLPPARDGNQVRLLFNGEASFAERARLIDEAERSIHIQALIFHGDTVGRQLGEALIRKKQATPAIDIRVIVDAYSNIQDVPAQLLFFEMQNAGIEVEGFEAFYLHWLNEIDLSDWAAGNKRYHEKYWIVDGEVAVLGGMNIGDEYARCSSDPVARWRDQDVRLRGPVVADVQAGFLDNFAQLKAIKQARPELLNPDSYWRLWSEKNAGAARLLGQTLGLGRDLAGLLPGREAPACDGEPLPSRTHEGVSVRYVRNRPREGERHIPALYLERIAAAQRTVLIENAYFVPRDDLVAALAAAARRGVQVQVINNSPATNDIPIISTAGRLRYRELVEAGVEVYEWHGERHGEGTVHAKLATFDGQAAIVGSYNLDPRSEGLNSEDVVLIESPAVASELAAFVRAQDLPKCDRVSLEDATAWADPSTLPGAPEKLPLWSDPRFDRDTFELGLLRAIEGSL